MAPDMHVTAATRRQPQSAQAPSSEARRAVRSRPAKPRPRHRPRAGLAVCQRSGGVQGGSLGLAADDVTVPVKAVLVVGSRPNRGLSDLSSPLRGHQREARPGDPGGPVVPGCPGQASPASRLLPLLGTTSWQARLFPPHLLRLRQPWERRPRRLLPRSALPRVDRVSCAVRGLQAATQGTRHARIGVRRGHRGGESAVAVRSDDTGRHVTVGIGAHASGLRRAG